MTISKQSELLRTIAGLDLPAHFYYYLQLTHPRHPGWFDWMPDNTLKKFSFKDDAYEEMEQLRGTDIPYRDRDTKWRVVFVCTIHLPLE